MEGRDSGGHFAKGNVPWNKRQDSTQRVTGEARGEQRTLCVCGQCKKPWEASGSPAICPDCGQASYAIAVPEHRVKLSAAMKKLWQNSQKAQIED